MIFSSFRCVGEFLSKLTLQLCHWWFCWLRALIKLHFFVTQLFVVFGTIFLSFILIAWCPSSTMIIYMYILMFFLYMSRSLYPVTKAFIAIQTLILSYGIGGLGFHTSFIPIINLFINKLIKSNIKTHVPLMFRSCSARVPLMFRMFQIMIPLFPPTFLVLKDVFYVLTKFDTICMIIRKVLLSLVTCLP